MFLKALLTSLLFFHHTVNSLNFGLKIFDNKINYSKSQSIKNKYIKIRKDFLQYVVANERAITFEISKRNK